MWNKYEINMRSISEKSYMSNEGIYIWMQV